MGRPTTLTKQWLLDHHIVNVTKDGRVFAKSKQGEIYEVNSYISKKPSRYKIQEYRKIGIYDKDERERQIVSYKEKGTYASGTKTLVLSRVIYAWYYNECPSGMDVDHINNDSLDDRLDNLQLLTRAENLAKRKGHRNQHESSLVE
ncbi:MAG: HNH endonuclease [Methanobrevibacter sp.]|nr:HNH endonuclease [Methanobrevibacter sp.]